MSDNVRTQTEFTLTNLSGQTLSAFRMARTRNACGSRRSITATSPLVMRRYGNMFWRATELLTTLRFQDLVRSFHHNGKAFQHFMAFRRTTSISSSLNRSVPIENNLRATTSSTGMRARKRNLGATGVFLHQLRVCGIPRWTQRILLQRPSGHRHSDREGVSDFQEWRGTRCYGIDSRCATVPEPQEGADSSPWLSLVNAGGGCS